MIEKWYRGLDNNQSKLINFVTSCGGHLSEVDLSMCHNSVNACQNKVKFCTLKIQDDVQLAIAKLRLPIKDCRCLMILEVCEATKSCLAF